MSDIYQQMYGQDEDEVAVSSTGEVTIPDRGIMSNAAMTSAIRDLQRVVRDQKQTIDKLVKDNRRLKMIQTQTIRSARSTNRDLVDMRYDVDNKIDRSSDY